MSIGNDRTKQYREPTIEKLWNNRFRITRVFNQFNEEDAYSDAIGSELFEDFGAADGTQFGSSPSEPRENQKFSNAILVFQKLDFPVGGDTSSRQLIKIYETLTDSFVQEKEDTTTYTESGLRRVQRVSIAKVGTDYTSTIRTSTISHQVDDETAVTLYLANYSIDDTDAYRRVTETWMEAGQISETTRSENGYIGMITKTYFISTPPTPSGYVLTGTQEQNIDGVPTNTYIFNKAKSGGSEVSYSTTTLVTVTPPGTVEAKLFNTPAVTLGDAGIEIVPSQNWTSGGVAFFHSDITSLLTIDSGTIAYYVAKPPIPEKVFATVTYRISTSPTPSVTQLAYNNAKVGVNMTAIVQRNTVSPTIGVITDPDVRERVFPNYHIKGDHTATGTMQTATVMGIINTTIKLEGSTTPPPTTGLLSFNARPIFTTTGGTQYYEIVEVTV